MGPIADLGIDLGKGWCMYKCVCAYRGGRELVPLSDRQKLHCLLQSNNFIQKVSPSMTYMKILHINTVQPR